MALSDAAGPGVVATRSGSRVGGWLIQHLAEVRPQDDPAIASPLGEVRDHLATESLGRRHLTLVLPVQPVDDRPAPMVAIRDVLTTWRAAERELNELPEGSPDWFRVNAELTGFRNAYHRLFNDRIAQDRPPLRLAEGWLIDPR